MTENTESYRSYLKGKYLLNKRSIKDINKAIKYFQHSISLDPINAHSYIQLADCYLLLQSYEQKSHEETITRVSEMLNDLEGMQLNISEFYITRGFLKMYLQFDLYEAEKDFMKALILNPNSIEAYSRYSRLLIYSNRFPEALVQMNLWSKVDPVSPLTNKNLARMFYCMGQYQNAITKLEESLELEPNDFEAYLLLGTNLAEVGLIPQALFALKRSLEFQYHVETICMIGYSHANSGDIESAEESIRLLEETAKKHYVSAANMGIIYAALGHRKLALECLEKALQERYVDLIGLKCDPRWAAIHSEPRFSEIIDEIGIPR